MKEKTLNNIKFNCPDNNRGILFRVDVEQAFNDARVQYPDIENCMYMHSDATYDYFKHINTRKYIEIKRIKDGHKTTN